MYILNVNEGSIPYHKGSFGETVEEQIILCRMTRAKKKLVLAYVKRQYEKEQEPRFLERQTLWSKVLLFVQKWEEYRRRIYGAYDRRNFWKSH